MIRLTRSDLKQMAQILVLANTPASLYIGLLRLPATAELKTCDPTELIEYYDRITAKARRNEIDVSFAYALLSVVLTKARDPRNAPIEVNRLEWGQQIMEYISSKSPANTEWLKVAGIKPSIVTINQSPSTPITILGANGRPMTWGQND